MQRTDEELDRATVAWREAQAFGARSYVTWCWSPEDGAWLVEYRGDYGEKPSDSEMLIFPVAPSTQPYGVEA